MATEVLTLRLSEELGGRLAALAKRTHRTKAFYARQALEAHLEDLEDYYLAAQEWQEFKASGEPVGDWAALRADIDAAAERAA